MRSSSSARWVAASRVAMVVGEQTYSTWLEVFQRMCCLIEEYRLRNPSRRWVAVSAGDRARGPLTIRHGVPGRCVGACGGFSAPLPRCLRLACRVGRCLVTAPSCQSAAAIQLRHDHTPSPAAYQRRPRTSVQRWSQGEASRQTVHSVLSESVSSASRPSSTA